MVQVLYLIQHHHFGVSLVPGASRKPVEINQSKLRHKGGKLTRGTALIE